MTLNGDLQRLIDTECAKANTHNVILRIESGNGQVRFKGSAAAARPEAPFAIASISKMFTATLILQLAEEGQIDLNQTVQSLLRTVDLSALHVVKGVDYGPSLSVRQLIHQTSGLADYYASNLSADLKQNIDRSFGLHDVLQMTRALPPQAAPDSGRSYYSDTNYQLLGAVIEAVTSQTFDQAVQSRICEPLGLRETAVLNDDDAGLPIYYKSQSLNVPRTLASMGPDGGILSTMDDLLTFLRAFIQGQLFNPENAAQIRQWNRLFFPFQYGYGVMRIKLPRWMTLFRATPELIGHSGASGSFAFHAPGPDIYLIGTFNQTDAPQRPISFMLKALRIIERHGIS
ncbi:serine hydrolase domain-containing protein [Meridianimarinicoccus aquatilis]|uniref:Class A beta-lactamase-related serine hydrolase n=1 Tax=Meridianimarinicoccus aquatilis TaxID=2552766 RepID=A0A4R6B1I9_9RHOB|nr:serine hydrolase domain-containing protein [Fluviibacterium aquatile]TDL90527.1 class A beta-lactamase-related serine hydrolase [Fluviibacterium aquatile]